jgi:hypothetical protein
VTAARWFIAADEVPAQHPDEQTTPSRREDVRAVLAPPERVASRPFATRLASQLTPHLPVPVEEMERFDVITGGTYPVATIRYQLSRASHLAAIAQVLEHPLVIEMVTLGRPHRTRPRPAARSSVLIQLARLCRAVLIAHR